MRRILDHRPSAAMVVAVLALVVALGGGAYAAIKLPANSVGSKQLKNNAVTSQKVKDRSLLATDFKTGQLPQGAQGLPGPQGIKGDPGATGQQGVKGDTGPSDVYEAHSNVPGYGSKSLKLNLVAGSYAVTAKLMAYNGSGGWAEADCTLWPVSDLGDSSVATVPSKGYATLADAGTYVTESATTINFACSSASSDMQLYQMRLIATKVGAVH